MIPKVASKRNAQLVVVVLCAAAVKLYYSAASVNQLRWILAPTTAAVELVSGSRFEFERHAGYLSGDRGFLIAASCAGVNFLISAFLMLSLRRLWGDRARDAGWRFIPWAALCAYGATIVANTIRISTALRLRAASPEAGWLGPSHAHRVEGIFIYFGFLLLLFVVSEMMGHESEPRARTARGLFRRACCPLLCYYATTLGIPLANGAYRQGADFWMHALFVFLIPLLLLLPLAALRLYRTHSSDVMKQAPPSRA